MSTDSIVTMNTKLIEKARNLAKILAGDAAAIKSALEKTTLFDVQFDGEIKDYLVTVDVFDPIKTSLRIPQSSLVEVLGGVGGMRQTLTLWIKKYGSVTGFSKRMEPETEYRQLVWQARETTDKIGWAINNIENLVSWLINGYESEYALSCQIGSNANAQMINWGISDLVIPCEFLFQNIDLEIKRREDELSEYIDGYEFLIAGAAAAKERV